MLGKAHSHQHQCDYHLHELNDYIPTVALVSTNATVTRTEHLIVVNVDRWSGVRAFVHCYLIALLLKFSF